MVVIVVDRIGRSLSAEPFAADSLTENPVFRYMFIVSIMIIALFTTIPISEITPTIAVKENGIHARKKPPHTPMRARGMQKSIAKGWENESN